jgi:uncharacterized protein (TIRG00374 family)
MSLRLRLLLFTVGLALAALIVRQVGVATLLSHLKDKGWLILPVVLVWGLVYTLNALGWFTMLGLEAARPPFPRVLAINITSFALNLVTPAGGLGGEGYRAYTLTRWLGQRRAVASVVQFRLMHSLVHMLFVMAALIPGLFLIPKSGAGIAVLAVSGLGGTLLAWFLHRRHQEGVLEAGLDLLLVLPGINRLARRLEPRRAALREMDQQITTLYHEHPGRFWRALGIELASRCTMPLELAIIIWGLGLGIRIPEAFVASALSTTLINLFFFLPLELGAREGGLYLVFSLLGLGGDHGAYAAIITRMRELIWAACGLALLWLQDSGMPRRLDGTPSDPTATPPA